MERTAKGANVRDDFGWIEDYFSPWPADDMRVEGTDLKFLYPLPTIDFFGFSTGMQWKFYELYRPDRSPEIELPFVSSQCRTREASDQYDDSRAQWLKECQPTIRHRFLVAFFIASGFSPSESAFEEMRKLAEAGEFRFENLWTIKLREEKLKSI
jgi:hypothetical protein